MSGVAGATEEVTALEVQATTPYFDIEVIADPYVDVVAQQDGEAPEDQARIQLVRRIEKLRKPFAPGCPHLVVACGTPRMGPRDVALGDGFWDGAFDAAVETMAGVERRPRVVRVPREGTEALPLPEVFRVCLVEDPEPFAHIAVVFFSSIRQEPAEFEGHLRELAITAARNVPLYVLGVIDGRALAANGAATDRFLGRCQQLRMSILLTGGLPQRDVPTLSRTPLEPGQGANDLAIVPCPPFKAGVGTPGMVRVRLDVYKGEAEIAFRYDLGSDRRGSPVQVGHTLTSLSRVRASERRLYARVHKILDDADAESPGFVARFRDRVKDAWDTSGYATLSDADRQFGQLPERLHKTYFLLLLLREREDGGHDILLNHHTPIRPSSMADWNTLLFPAFREPRDLLERLRNDVMRQAVERAEDLEQAERARYFSRAVDAFLEADAEARDGLWVDQLREVAQTTTRKISPTDGCITEFEYHLVTLLPLVERPDVAGAGEDDRQVAARIIQWLDGLESVRAPDVPVHGTNDIPVDALASDGAGLRWNPAVELVDRPNDEQRRSARKLPPGAVWFPLSAEGEPLWHGCPSIESRNRDVMQWVGEVLQEWQRDQQFQGLVLGRSTRGSDTYEIVEEWPFDSSDGESTVRALRNVKLDPDYDLGDERAYPEPAVAIKRVVLLKRKVEMRDREREVIVVYDAKPYDDAGFDAGVLSKEHELGRLRPVQRYVLTPGLARANDLYEQVTLKLSDRWGFARIVKGSTPREVAVTPPIVEALHFDDWDECSGPRDFVVCDGNHRVVQKAWNDPVPLPAIALAGDLPYPYYAHPFGAFEWQATADNELRWTPNPASKYLPRRVMRGELRKELRDKRDAELFRRYYRKLDAEHAFGYMGGQGGQFAG
ncbi:MAG: hypothetical protein ACJ768_25980 [Gaiellaceae bacterium]